MNPRIPHHKVPCTSIISESEESITVLCLPCSPHYTAVQIKNCSKSMPVIKVATMLKYDDTTCYIAVRIKSYLKSTPAIKVATMKKYGQFPLLKGSHHQINAFHCQQG